MKTNRFYAKGLAAAALLAVTALQPALAQVMDLVSDVAVSGSSVRLSDVINNTDGLPADWGDRVVASSPAAGQSRLLALADVAAALHPYEDMHQVVLRGQADIRVTGKAMSWDPDGLDAALAQFLLQNERWNGKRFRVSRKRLPFVQAQAREGTIQVDAIRQDEADGGFLADIGFVDVEAAGEGQSRLSIPLDELKPYWAVVRPLLRGAMVTAEDVEIKWMPVDEAARCYPADQPIAGMEAKRNLQTGQVPKLGMLDAPFCARRGEVVRVQFDRGGLSVTLRARALSDGRREERIACVNERSGRRMHVRLTDVREAVLEEGAGS